MNGSSTPQRLSFCLFALQFGIATFSTLQDGEPLPEDFKWGKPTRIECDEAIVYCFTRGEWFDAETLLAYLNHYMPAYWHIVFD